MKELTMGGLIATLRKEKNMTQAELAARLNVTDKAVSKWERDLCAPDIAALPTLAEALGVSVEELIAAHRAKAAPAAKAKGEEILGIILKAIPLAMSVALIVLSVLDSIEMNSAVPVVGIALFSLALDRLRELPRGKN